MKQVPRRNTPLDSDARTFGTMEKLTSLGQIEWTQLKEAILQQKCVLFLGPGVTVNYGDAERQAAFFKGLATKYPDRILSFHHEDGFLVFKNLKEKLMLLSEIKAFYMDIVPSPLLELLARIPFHLFVVATPDLSLNRAFAKQSFFFNADSYTSKKESDLAQMPTREEPLLYNLLGCETDSESLITNHSDFFDLIKSIYGDKTMPQMLKDCFHAAHTSNIVFLGFEFDKWYFQLLLHLLCIKLDDDEGFLYAAAQGLPSVDNKLLMEAQFRVSFVSNDIDGWVQTLHDQFAPAELRSPAPGVVTARKYHMPNILRLMTLGWTTQEFETFCFINFTEVYAEFTPSMPQSARILHLIEHLKTKGLFEQFLEMGREENSHQYEECGPYYEK